MRLAPRGSPVRVALGESGVAAFASRHGSGWSMPEHAEPWHKLLLVLDGAGTLACAGRTLALQPSLLVLVAAGSAHRVVDEPGRQLVLLGVCLDAKRLEAACGASWPALAQRLARGVRLDASTRAEAVRLLGGLLAKSRREDDAGLAGWGRILLLLAAVRAAKTPARLNERDGVDATLGWIDDHLGEPLAIAALAARAGLSYRALTAQVRQRTGESVLARILRLRLERAAALLRSGVPVIEAAYASGFGDLSGFYRHFRRRYATTPGRLVASSHRQADSSGIAP